jgi:hypothetical protein
VGKGEVALLKRTLGTIAILMLVCLVPVATRAAQKPLSQDDVTLLLIGGVRTEKMVALIEQRGIDFQMNPDLAKKFHDAGADDLVIEALQKAGARAGAPARVAPKPAAVPASSVEDSPPSVKRSATAPAGGAEQTAASTPATLPAPAASAEKTTASPEAASPAKPKQAVNLTDPSPAEIQQIIQEFAAKETLFKQARDNYTFHQVNRVVEYDADGNVVGTFEQDWDILYDDNGGRIERVTYAPVPTLKRLGVTQEDLDAMRNIQPFVLTSNELPEYDIKYLGHVKVDYITAYVFSIRPKEIRKDHLYFQGTVWVDDRDLQIVKSEGKSVPETRTKKGENLFPRFATYREQIDGKYWFPTFTMADDTLYFSTGPVHIKEVIRYSDYKQFKSKVRILSATPTDTPEPK